MSYVDEFVVAVSKQNLDAYKSLARVAGEVWKEHGAIAYVEYIEDDVTVGELTSFPAPSRRRTTKSSSCHGSSTPRVNSVTPSTPRS